MQYLKTKIEYKKQGEEYVKVEQETSQVSQSYVDNFLEWIPTMRKLGGLESVRRKGNTITNISISPDGDKKYVTTFVVLS